MGDVKKEWSVTLVDRRTGEMFETKARSCKAMYAVIEAMKAFAYKVRAQDWDVSIHVKESAE